MTNQKLLDYIKNQKEQGKTKEEIKNELLGAGWQELIIDQTLGTSGSSTPPKPPSLAPSPMSIEQQHLDPKAVWLFFFQTVFVFLFIAIWIGFYFIVILYETFSGFLLLGIGLVILLGMIIFSFIWAKLTYHFYRYELIEEGFRKELGVIFKKYVTIPYDRIQNVDIHRGILARILGLSVLNIQTAGSAGTSGTGVEGSLPGLSREEAEKIRDELIHRARSTRNQGL